MRVFRLNELSKFDNSKNVFFRKYENVLTLFNQLRGRTDPCILISGNSDYPVTKDLLDQAPPCIKKWFAQVVCIEDPRLVALPFGVENIEDATVEGQGNVPRRYKNGSPYGEEKKNLLTYPISKRKPTRKIYANFATHTNNERVGIAKICESANFITCEAHAQPQDQAPLSFSEYTEQILDHDMVVCPEGNAPADTHRMWEVLYMNRVPIIKWSRGVSPFTDLPVVVINDWEYLKNEKYIYHEFSKVKNNSRRMLDIKFWEDQVKSACSELL